MIKYYEIIDQISYHETMRDFYSGSNWKKKIQQEEIDRLVKLLKDKGEYTYEIMRKYLDNTTILKPLPICLRKIIIDGDLS
tara:strand:- start:227 stop:469 length:243 start_codon:yes stop_codon:yes gene_type:complete